MRVHAMSISIWVRATACSATLAAALACSAPGLAQKQEDPDVRDIASTPFQDLNLMGDEIPEALITAEVDPYAHADLTDCNAIVAEIAELDTILGEDYDITIAASSSLTVGKAAKGLVGTLIPFRGVVREVSGAAGDERKARAAVMAGMVRRGYLKGLGQGRECDYPARPKIIEPSE